jgi:hypothetical protein
MVCPCGWVAQNEDGTQKEPANVLDFGENNLGKFRVFLLLLRV